VLRARLAQSKDYVNPSDSTASGYALILDTTNWSPEHPRPAAAAGLAQHREKFAELHDLVDVKDVLLDRARDRRINSGHFRKRRLI